MVRPFKKFFWMEQFVFQFFLHNEMILRTLDKLCVLELYLSHLYSNKRLFAAAELVINATGANSLKVTIICDD